MIGILDRLKVHHLREGGLVEEAIAAKVSVSLRSVERILAEPPPSADDLRAGAVVSKRRAGRPSKAEAFRDQVIALLAEEGHEDLPSTEVLRRSHDWGYRGRRSAMFELVKRVRPVKSKEPLVRFEGLPGEFAQFDFGEAWVRFTDGTRRKMTFFAGRLKYSRFVWIVLTTNQQAESLIRALLACLAAFGGAPKDWVFDNPKTVRISKPGEPIVFHQYLRDLSADLNVLPTLCAPRTPRQKGSVENLVGFVKKNFFFVRKFRDLAHLRDELAGWHQEVNFERPCDATNEIPHVLRQRELQWLERRPLRWTPASYALRESAIVTPVATVRFAGTSYGAPPKRIGATATLLVHAESIEVIVDKERCVHLRCDNTPAVQRLPEQRREMLTVIHGQRKQNYYRRECLMQLGASAFDFLEQLIHRSNGSSWSPVVNDLFELLQHHGEDRMRAAFAECHGLGRYDASSVAHAIRRAA